MNTCSKNGDIYRERGFIQDMCMYTENVLKWRTEMDINKLPLTSALKFDYGS